jgi:hypothetical protein
MTLSKKLKLNTCVEYLCKKKKKEKKYYFKDIGWYWGYVRTSGQTDFCPLWKCQKSINCPILFGYKCFVG